MVRKFVFIDLNKQFVSMQVIFSLLKNRRKISVSKPSSKLSRDMSIQGPKYVVEGEVGHEDQVLANLYPALIQCVFVIFAGYSAGRLKFIPTNGIKGKDIFSKQKYGGNQKI